MAPYLRFSPLPTHSQTKQPLGSMRVAQVSRAASIPGEERRLAISSLTGLQHRGTTAAPFVAPNSAAARRHASNHKQNSRGRSPNTSPSNRSASPLAPILHQHIPQLGRGNAKGRQHIPQLGHGNAKGRLLSPQIIQRPVSSSPDNYAGRNVNPHGAITSSMAFSTERSTSAPSRLPVGSSLSGIAQGSSVTTLPYQESPASAAGTRLSMPQLPLGKTIGTAGQVDAGASVVVPLPRSAQSSGDKDTACDSSSMHSSSVDEKATSEAPVPIRLLQTNITGVASPLYPKHGGINGSTAQVEEVPQKEMQAMDARVLDQIGKENQAIFQQLEEYITYPTSVDLQDFARHITDSVTALAVDLRKVAQSVYQLNSKYEQIDLESIQASSLIGTEIEREIFHLKMSHHSLVIDNTNLKEEVAKLLLDQANSSEAVNLLNHNSDSNLKDEIAKLAAKQAQLSESLSLRDCHLKDTLSRLSADQIAMSDALELLRIDCEHMKADYSKMFSLNHMKKDSLDNASASPREGNGADLSVLSYSIGKEEYNSLILHHNSLRDMQQTLHEALNQMQITCNGISRNNDALNTQCREMEEKFQRIDLAVMNHIANCSPRD